MRLPDDYRAFLRASDGFLTLAGSALGCSLEPVGKLGWFRDRDVRTGRLDAYRPDFGGADPGDVSPERSVEADEPERTLLIGESDGNECVLLLPPGIDNDWEIWTYDPEAGFGVAGSLRELMDARGE